MKLKTSLKTLLLIDGLSAFTISIVKSKLPCLRMQFSAKQSSKTLSVQPSKSLLFFAKYQLETERVLSEE